VDVDAHEPGILRVSCTGEQRFQLAQSHQRADGLWCGQVRLMAADASLTPPAELAQTVAALSNAIEALQAQGQLPFAEPHRLDDAGWVANRWCELLPISLQARQRLMELDQPIQRLKLVDDFLRGKGVV
jgi:Lon protease-like protein